MTASKKELRDKLQQPFDSSNWKTILMDVFPNRLSLFKKPVEVASSEEYIESFNHTGKVLLEDGKKLAFFEVKVQDRVNLLKNRVGLRNSIAKLIDEYKTHGVLCVFSSSDPSYRFTFVVRETILEEDGTIGKRETDAKRFTYVLGPSETCTTAAERFHRLAEASNQAGLKEVEEAFSVDRLNRAFFDRYKEHFLKFVNHLVNNAQTLDLFGIDSSLRGQKFEAACKPIRDFVKKLLGRIVFIYFLQKKGWMGCAPGSSKWEGGAPDFLRSLFNQTSPKEKERFYSNLLSKLFYECLNKPERDGDLFDLTNSRVPYLNGTLFEPSSIDEAKINFPSAYFGDLFDFLSSYNFTIDENDPGDQEVGIDPEMLGHIFENLLEENKKMGTYYTPKPVVQYMCQEAILKFLESHLGEDLALTNLVLKKDVGDPSLKENWVRVNAALIEELLDNIEICDPAIGSGAFPIGILQEIFWLKLTVDRTLNDPAKLAEVKRRILQKSIYGVDLDAGAVEVARLRCWLALVVDESEPRPLPNLDYKIMQGDSLLESFAGIDLSNLTNTESKAPSKANGQQNLNLLNPKELSVNRMRSKEILSLINQYFDESDPVRKTSLHNDIDNIVIEHIDYNVEIEKVRIKNRKDEILSDIKYKKKQLNSWEIPINTQRKIENINQELEDLDSKKRELIKSSIKRERPYFLWNLYFHKVMSKGGFDIVIANPPYINTLSTKNKDDLISHYTTYDPTGDIYVCFYQLAHNLVKCKGVVCFITSNQFFRADYGRKIRSYLLDENTLYKITDLSTAPVFKAAAYPAIIILLNDYDQLRYTKVFSWEEECNPDFTKFEQIVQNRTNVLPKEKIDSRRWLPIKERKIDLLNHLLNIQPNLINKEEFEIRRGVVTGKDNVFIVGSDIRDQLDCDIIKPILKGKDLSTWSYQFEDRYLIFTQRGININNYPILKKYLQPFRNKLEPGKEGGRKPGPYQWYEIQDSTAYAHLFDQPKIAWGNLATSPKFSWVPAGTYLNAPSTFLVGADYSLLTILNSPICHFFIHYTAAVRQGGYREYKKTFLGNFPCPTYDDKTRAKLTDIALSSIDGNTYDCEETIRAISPIFELSNSHIDLLIEFVDEWNQLMGN